MSSVVSRPFGETRAPRSKMGMASKANFMAIVDTEDVYGMTDFLEFVYETKVRIKLTEDSYKLTFQSLPHRTEAGLRFVVGLFEAELVYSQMWF